jgi:hypothetical protein
VAVAGRRFLGVGLWNQDVLMNGDETFAFAQHLLRRATQSIQRAIMILGRTVQPPMNHRSRIGLLAHRLRWRWPRPSLAGSAICGLLAFSAGAQARMAEQALRATWTLQLAPTAFQADSDVRAATSLQPIGTELDFESSLGLSQRRQSPEVLLAVRPWNRHRFTLGHFRVERSGSTTVAGEVRFAGQVFGVGTSVRSRLETQVASFDYAYSVWQSPSAEVTLGLGLHRVDLQAMLASPSESRSAIESASLIAPTLRLGGSAALDARWSIHGHWHELQHRHDEYRGSLRSYQVAVQAQLTPQVAAALGFRHFQLHLDVGRPDWVGFARTRYRGPFVALAVTY